MTYTMIDRDERATARTLIQRLPSGEVTNFCFDNAFPSGGDDPALAAIHQKLWFFWDDRFTHKLDERYREGEARALFERCIAFLNSDLEYEWPSIRGASLWLVLLRMIRANKKAKERERQELEELKNWGNLGFWPFVSQADYEKWAK